MKVITEKAKLGVRFAADLLALRDDDVLLCSFPRSGNTWTRFMYCHLLMVLQGRSADEVDFPFLDSTMPAVGAGNVRDEWAFAPYPRLVKTHAPWMPFFRGKRSIGLVRDPRDVMVSYYHYQKDRNQLFDGSFSDFIRHRRYGLRRWFDHLYSWRTKWNLVVTYEEMKSNTLEQMIRIVDFLGIDVGSKKIDKAISRSAIERIQRVDKLASEDSNTQFARKGNTRQWKEYFSDEDLMLYHQLNKT